MNTKGIFTALLTPFDSTGNINITELRRHVRRCADMGVSGFYVCGSTAEAFLMSADERKLIMRTVKESAPELTLIAHIGSLDERVAAELGRYARELSYDVVSSVAPFYYKFSSDEIRSYYYRLADASELPMLVYHFPAFSGVNMGVDDMSAFLSDDRFCGIKYTSNDFFMLERCRSLFPNKLIYNGFDEMLLSGLAAGADGGIGSTYNFMADKFIGIFENFNQGRIDMAQQLQRDANKIISVLCRVGVMQGEKEVLCQLGFDFGICRSPFGQLDTEQKELISHEIMPLLRGE